MTTTAVRLRIGRPPRLPRRERRVRLARRIGWYALGWVLFGGCSYYLVLGDVAVWLALLIPVACVTNPFTPKHAVAGGVSTTPVLGGRDDSRFPRGGSGQAADVLP